MGSIKNFIEKIKSARYGKDVRQSIVDAIEQTYDDAIANGHTDMEVAKARNTYNDLNSRLEADKNKMKEIIENEKNDRKSNFENIQNKVNSLASGSPLVASNTSEMTDKSRVYVNTTDGHWYYYDENWKDGGIYQGVEIEDNSVVEEKTSFYKLNANKFLVKNICEKGYNIRYDYDTGITSIGGTVIETGGVEVSRFTVSETISFKYTRQTLTAVNSYVKIFNINDLVTPVRTLSANTTDSEFELPTGTYAIYIQANMNTVLSEKSRYCLVPLNIYNSQNIVSTKVNLYKNNYYSEHENKLNKDLYPFENLLIAHLINPNSNFVGKLDLVNKQITINKNTRLVYSYLSTNKQMTSYTNMHLINSDFNETINILDPNYSNALYYICLDYLGNLLSIPDGLFSNINDNYYIIGILSVTNENIVSYNMFDNRFNIVGGKETDIDFSNMTLTCIGDSLTHPSEGGANALDPMYPEIVKNILGLGDFTNCGLSGSTVANNSSSPSTPMSDDTRMASYPNSDIIIIGGGYNDYGNSVPLGSLSTNDETTFYGGYKKLMNYLITNNPASTIIIMITPMANSTPTSPKNEAGLTKLDYINAIKDLARYFSVPLLDMNQLGSLGQFNKNTWTNDGLHFKQEYVNKIYAPRIAKFIKDLLS